MTELAREDVTYFSDGLRIGAWFYPAPEASPESPAPALVYCPGFAGTKQIPYYQIYVDYLVNHGYSVLLIDFRCWGDSEGERGLIYPLEQVADVRNALTYLETRSDVDADRLGVFGVSFGGAHAMYVAGIDPRVRVAVAVLSPMDGRESMRRKRREWEWIEFVHRLVRDRKQRVLTGVGETVDLVEEIMMPTPERRAVKPSDPGQEPVRTPLACAEAVAEYMPIDVVGKASPRAALLWFCATEDPVVPPDHARRAYAVAGEPKRLVELPSATHYGTYMEHKDRILGEAVSWCDRYLRGQ